MILLIGNVLDRQTYRSMVDLWMMEAVKWWVWREMENEYRAFFLRWWKYSEIYCDDSCSILWILYIINVWYENCESESHSVVSDSLQPHGLYRILWARILEWVAFPFSRGSSRPWHQTQVSHIAGRFFTIWANQEAETKTKNKTKQTNKQKTPRASLVAPW